MNEEQQQQEPPWRFSQAKYHRWGFLLSWLLIKKNDYRSVISIAVISDIIFHMVAISTCNKGDG